MVAVSATLKSTPRPTPSPTGPSSSSSAVTTTNPRKWWSNMDEGRIGYERKQMLKLLGSLLLKSKGAVRDSKFPLMARRLEESLLRSSESLESYRDPKTLRDRLRHIAKQAKANSPEKKEEKTPVSLLDTMPRSFVDAHLRSLTVDDLRDRAKKALDDVCKRHKAHWLFLEPVDPVKLGIPNYFHVVKHPMDLSTIRRRLDRFEYDSATDVLNDCNLMFENAMLFNGPESQIGLTAKEMADDIVRTFQTDVFSTDHRTACAPVAAPKSPHRTRSNDAAAADEDIACGTTPETTTTTPSCGGGKDDDACALCRRNRLKLTALAYRCDGPGCEGQRVRKGALCFFDPQHRQRYCRTCFDKLGLPETNFVRERAGDDDDAEEPWVQCERCSVWVHQVCALFNPAANSQNAVYFCPNCTAHEPKAAEVKGWRAKDIETTALSRDLEARVRTLIRREAIDLTATKPEDDDVSESQSGDDASENNDDLSSSNSVTIASTTEDLESDVVIGKKLSEEDHPVVIPNLGRRKPSPLPKGGAIYVREVSTVTEDHFIKPRLLQKLREAKPDHVSSFQATSRCVALFQEIDGVDVMLLALYVYEYGGDAPLPNRRRLYVSYLDSVSYLRPKDARTSIYRDLLVGYLADAKRRGFHTAHIWACPPKRGDDYIFHAKPKHQRVPTDDRLRKWYAAALDQARLEGVVNKVTTFWEDHLAPVAENVDEATVFSSLPHFEGDYWPAEVERLFDAVDKEAAAKKSSGGCKDDAILELSSSSSVDSSVEPPKKKSKLSTPRQRASLAPAKKNLVLARLAKTMQAMKDSFLVAHLEPRALAGALDASGAPTTTTPAAETVAPKPAAFAGGRDILRTRQHFLDVCQGNHYQFDELRRAKHATMMVLYHVHHPEAPLFPTTCTKCGADVPSGAVCRQCQIKQEPRLLRIRKPSLIVREATAAQPPKPPVPKTTTIRIAPGSGDRAELRQGLLHLLDHASTCTEPQCTVPHCAKMKQQLEHFATCKLPSRYDQCRDCRRIFTLLAIHARQCTRDKCPVRCCAQFRLRNAKLTAKADDSNDASGGPPPPKTEI